MRTFIIAGIMKSFVNHDVHLREAMSSMGLLFITVFVCMVEATEGSKSML